MFRALLIICILLISVQAHARLSGQAKLDSLLAELPKAKGDTNEVNLLSQLSDSYQIIDPDKGIKYGKQGLLVAKDLNWKLGLGRIYNSLGINNWAKSKNSLAINYYEKSIEIREEIGDKSGLAATLGNIGVLYKVQSNYPKAFEYFGQAIRIYEELGDKFGVASNLGNMGNIYVKQSDLSKALEYYKNSLKIMKELGEKSGVAKLLGNIGNIFEAQSNYEDAIEYYESAREMNEEIGNKSSLAINLLNIGLIHKHQKNYIKAIEYTRKSLEINKRLGRKNGEALNYGLLGSLYLSLSQDSVNIDVEELNELVSLNKEINLNKGIEYTLRAISISEKIGDLKGRIKWFANLADAYNIKGNYKKAFEVLAEHKKLQDSVFNIDKEKEIANLTAVREKEVAEKELVISQLENDQRKKESYLLYGGLGLLVFVVLIIFRQRRQSEKLLLNILPAKIAKRLKKRKADIADDIENASTVFIDLVGFTEYSKDKKASDVLKMLNQIFSRIDKLVLKHGLEKIKTIGDGYMAAAGVPEYQEDHTKRAADFALDVHKELEKFNSENGTDISARIGIESGPMVAGVIGDMKFIYDLWGDTVNTASRMESTGTPNKVHITENFKLELEKHQNGFVFSEPIEMDIKGKGKMKTFYMGCKALETV